MPKKKDQIISMTCGHFPDCKWKILGNWEKHMKLLYEDHYFEKHYIKPYIKYQDEK